MGTFHNILRQGGTFGVGVDCYEDKEAKRLASGYGASALQSIAARRQTVRLVRPTLRGALLGLEIGTSEGTLPVGAG